MKNTIKLLSLVFILSLTTVACNDTKACAEDCKKECCKEEAEEAAVDSPTEVTGEEQAHVCTVECTTDPHSCPNHSHADHAH
jgi:predicted small secreted protein